MAQRTEEPNPEPAEDRPGEVLPLVELETMLNRPPSTRKRLMQIGLILLAGIVALMVFRGTSASPRPAASAPTVVVPTHPPLPPTLLIYSSVNYGAVTINGKKQAGQLPLLVPLHGNTFDIDLDAPPFRSISCHVDLAAVESGNGPFDVAGCIAFPLSAADRMSFNGVTAIPTVELGISLGPDDLPPEQQSQVTALLTRALNMQQTLTLPAGSYFATSFHAPTTITSQRARAPLRASAIVAPVSQDQDAYSVCGGFTCSQAIGVGLTFPPSGQQWAISVLLASRWRFSNASGAVVGDASFQGGQLEFPINLFLAFDETGVWTIAPNDAVASLPDQLQDIFCATGESILQQMIETSNGGYEDNVLNNQRALGCEIQTYVYNTYHGAFLWRFGVLMAVDKQAHATAPQLPMAPQAEVNALGA